MEQRAAAEASQLGGMYRIYSMSRTPLIVWSACYQVEVALAQRGKERIAPTPTSYREETLRPRLSKRIRLHWIPDLQLYDDKKKGDCRVPHGGQG